MHCDNHAYKLAFRMTSDPLYPAAKLLFQEPFERQYAAEALVYQQDRVADYCCAILDTPALMYEDAPGRGCAPINAVHLLAEWKIDAAIPRLWRIAEEVDEEWFLNYEAYRALQDWGPTLLGFLFSLVPNADQDTLFSIGMLMSLNGRGHPQVHDWVLARFEEQENEVEIRCWAECLLIVDHERAIPYLQARILKDKQYSDDLKKVIRSYIRNTRKAGMP